MQKKNHKFFIVSYLILSLQSLSIAAISSNMSHRVLSSSPLLYRMIDYTKRQTYYGIEPMYMSMYDQTHTIQNLTPQGKQTLQFNQNGKGDINPAWFNLMSNNTDANYNSQVTFSPSLTQSGALFQWYHQFDSTFINISTALVQCKSEIVISEIGGGNGLNPGALNAQQAFTQESWNAGKIGQANHVVGLDDIELRYGGIYRATSLASTYDLTIAGFGIVQAPTGSGTQAEWLFEPQVGTNHWGLGFGFETLVSNDDDIRFMIAANYRYLIPAWETRSFDLLNCGPWSRYLGLQDTYGLPTAPATLTLPGINYLTQQAYINGRSQLNIYTRLQKQLKSSSLEISYNFLCTQQETIGTIKNMPDGFGIYAMTGESTGAGGVTTAPIATINENITEQNVLGHPQTLSVANFDKKSACQQTYVSNNLTGRFEIQNNNMTLGFGANIEVGLSSSALSTWSVWAQFGLLFGGKNHKDTYNPLSDEPLYELNQNNHEIQDHTKNISKNIIQKIEYDHFEQPKLSDDRLLEKQSLIDQAQLAQTIHSLENDLNTLELRHGIKLIDDQEPTDFTERLQHQLTLDLQDNIKDSHKHHGITFQEPNKTIELNHHDIDYNHQNLDLNEKLQDIDKTISSNIQPITAMNSIIETENDSDPEGMVFPKNENELEQLINKDNQHDQIHDEHQYLDDLEIITDDHDADIDFNSFEYPDEHEESGNMVNDHVDNETHQIDIV